MQNQVDSGGNPFLALDYEPAFESLGPDYFDVVAAAEFPAHILRFRNDPLLPQLGLNPAAVTDQHFIETFGRFESVHPFLAMRYHGYQFGEYNPNLGDGRGFLYGQVRGVDRELYDFGTKGSGTTPYSRSGDGRLTLKGGVREVLAAEALYALGVRTSRCLSLIETGDQLWRGDEPSPTRASVMIRVNRSHIRFGTFERLHHLERKDLIHKLLDHVIQVYYPHLQGADRYALFYAELVRRVAEVVAQWMSVGFCHAVLNTDNMSITGESFDYGPYAFINTFDPQFTAAYFDYYQRYSYGNQPEVCHWNLTMLQRPLAAAIDLADMEAGLAHFHDHYVATYTQRMVNKLGFATLPTVQAEPLVRLTVQLLQTSQVGYHEFFTELAQQFEPEWQGEERRIFGHVTIAEPLFNSDSLLNLLSQWRQAYYQALCSVPFAEMVSIAQRLTQQNPVTPLLRPEIEAVWDSIAQQDDWQPFYQLLKKVMTNG